MRRKDKYKLRVIRREALYAHDEPDHTLMIVETEAEPIELEMAGEFVSRRSVTFHDLIKGSGPMQGYAMVNFQHGSIYSRFKGHRNGDTKVSTGTWNTYRGIGKLGGVKGEGTFEVTAGERLDEFILYIEGEYKTG